MSNRRKTPPKRVYLEVWPADSGMTDQLHYVPTGYGQALMGRGATSQIYVYERVPVKRLKTKRKP